jgi:hypothetical protein
MPVRRFPPFFHVYRNPSEYHLDCHWTTFDEQSGPPRLIYHREYQGLYSRHTLEFSHRKRGAVVDGEREGGKATWRNLASLLSDTGSDPAQCFPAKADLVVSQESANGQLTSVWFRCEPRKRLREWRAQSREVA